jgi:predicted phage terminase large subunit-like protein
MGRRFRPSTRMPTLSTFAAAELAKLKAERIARTGALESVREEADQLVKSFRAFIAPAYEAMEAGDAWAEMVRRKERPGKFIPGWHVDAIADHLQAVAAGDIKRLLINVPPSTMKSTLTCVLWPVWMWTLDPKLRFIFSSYSEDFTKRDARKAKQLMETEWFQARFAHVRLADSPDTQMERHTTAGGERHGASTNSGVTGKHVHGIVEDDPIKAQDADSQEAREKAFRYHGETLSSRLLPEAGWRVLQMQRLHEDDPSGRILAKEGGRWVHLCLPMEFEEKRRCVTPIFADPRKQDGELLWPQRLNEEYVEDLKDELGARASAGQLQQRPAPEAGTIIQRVWFRRYKEAPPLDELDLLLMSWDMKFKKEGRSWVVGQVWGKLAANAFLLDQVRKKWDFVETLAGMRMLCARWPMVLLKLVEDAANGPAVISTLQNEIPGIVAVTPKGSKIARLSAVSPVIQAGNIWVPEKGVVPWVEEYIEEVCVFPNGRSDDQADATSQALARLYPRRKKPTGPMGLNNVGERPNPNQFS